MTMPTASAEQIPDPTLPNLPKPDNDLSPVGGSYVSALAYVGPSKQWIQIVDAKVVAVVNFIPVPIQSDRCRALFGDDSVRCVNERTTSQKMALSARAFPTNFVGDDAASPPADPSELRRSAAEFTDFPVQRVRLVAFGAIPAEADLHISLTEDGSGLPIGLRVDADTWTSPDNDVTDSAGTGRLRVRLSNLRVDGRPVEVGAACELSEPGELSISGRGYKTGGPGPKVPLGRYNPNFGGLLQGTLSIGKFEGCGESDDISPLVTAMAGNSQLPIRIFQAQVNFRCISNVPTTPILESDCYRAGKLDFPRGEVPPELPPSYQPAPPLD